MIRRLLVRVLLAAIAAMEAMIRLALRIAGGRVRRQPAPTTPEPDQKIDLTFVGTGELAEELFGRYDACMIVGVRQGPTENGPHTLVVLERNIVDQPGFMRGAAELIAGQKFGDLADGDL